MPRDAHALDFPSWYLRIYASIGQSRVRVFSPGDGLLGADLTLEGTSKTALQMSNTHSLSGFYDSPRYVDGSISAGLARLRNSREFRSSRSSGAPRSSCETSRAYFCAEGTQRDGVSEGGFFWFRGVEFARIVLIIIILKRKKSTTKWSWLTSLVSLQIEVG